MQMPKFWSHPKNNAANEKWKMCVTELKTLLIAKGSP